MANDTLHIPAERAHEWAIALLQHVGLAREHAQIVAHGLVLADLRGIDSHGLLRLPGYLERIEAGSLNISPGPFKFDMKTPVMATLDAQNTFGFIAGHMAINKATEMAETYGIGMVAVQNSNHFGMAANYAMQAVEKGFAAMVFTNASRSMPAWGSREPLLGTSPVAIAFPGGSSGDFVLDMSPSVVARGKVRKAARRNESIPEGWMLDQEGRPTTNPHEALKGTVLPIGGPKGSGLATVMDIFGGVITGAAFAGDVRDQYSSLSEPQKVGHSFIVFRPDMFLPSHNDYRDRMDVLFDRIRNSTPAHGVSRIYTPGEIEAETFKVRSTAGIPYTHGELEILQAIGREVQYKLC